MIPWFLLSDSRYNSVFSVFFYSSVASFFDICLNFPTCLPSVACMVPCPQWWLFCLRLMVELWLFCPFWKSLFFSSSFLMLLFRIMADLRTPVSSAFGPWNSGILWHTSSVASLYSSCGICFFNPFKIFFSLLWECVMRRWWGSDESFPCFFFILFSVFHVGIKFFITILSGVISSSLHHKFDISTLMTLPRKTVDRRSTISLKKKN